MRHRLLVPLLLLLAALPLAAIVMARGERYEWTKVTVRPPLERTEVAGAAVAQDVYVIGGFVRPNTTTAAVERFNTLRRRWKRVRALPVPLNHAAAVGYRGHVYVVGGYASRDGLTDPVKTLYRYDPQRGRWRRLPGMATARAGLAVGVVRGRLYAAGGAAGGKQ